MSSSRTPSWRTGVVTALVAGPTAQVTVAVGGDSATTANLSYLDSYDPDVGDTVQLLVNQGAALVLGRAAANPRRIWGQTTASAGPISTSEVNLVIPTPTALVTDGLGDVRVDWSWDSYTGTTAGDRLSLRVKASLNGGAFTTVARTLLRCTAVAAEGGGSSFIRIAAPAAGSWAYKLVGVLEAGTGTFTVNAGSGATSPITFAAERSA